MTESNLEYLYLLVCPGFEWEDTCIYTSVDMAIEESIKNPECRVEILFCKDGKYMPTYGYYKVGNLVLPN
jgi:hypothetical protein